MESYFFKWLHLFHLSVIYYVIAFFSQIIFQFIVFIPYSYLNYNSIQTIKGLTIETLTQLLELHV